MKSIILLKLRRLAAVLPGAVFIKRKLQGWGPIYIPPATYPKDRGGYRVVDGPEDPSTYRPDTFVLYRIIGNDLVPRHRKGQSRENLKFILNNESELGGCQKRFVVNRIVDPEEEEGIISLLQDFGMPYIYIPFNEDEYRLCSWDTEGVPAKYAPNTKLYASLDPVWQGEIQMRLYRYKNNYVMNNNGARNVALRDGRQRAKWVLPWDGNCFVTPDAWESIRSSVTSNPELRYHLVPMARMLDNTKLLNPGFKPQATEEPQILFRHDASLEFNPEFCYGRRPKVELFWRLGVPGKWDDWPIRPWDLPCPDYATEVGQYGEGGWVARLFSGKAELEKHKSHSAWVERGKTRVSAVTSFLDHLDAKLDGSSLNPQRPVFANEKALSQKVDERLFRQLKMAADKVLGSGPYSVVDKTSLPPSGDNRDYWHPAPYYWPNPLRIPGLPYVRRDGKRVPGTRLYEPGSDKYDRTRLQRLFDNSYILALASRMLGVEGEGYGTHAAELVRHWFLNPDTAMNPHLKYAQVRTGHGRNQGNCSGIIEMKDLYYFLDAVRLLRRDKFLSDDDYSGFQDWLEQYLLWLRESKQGRAEFTEANNHGVYYDLQIASIYTFLGREQLLMKVLRDSRYRIIKHFDGEGRQPEELARTTTVHYCCFNLQGWIHLARLAESVGEDLWSFEGPEGQCLRRGMEWLLSHMGKPWPYQQIGDFDSERFLPIYYAYLDKYGEFPRQLDMDIPARSEVKPVYFSHDGIRPFWQV